MTHAAPPTPVAGRRVLVVGLGRFGGGVGVTRWLVEQGARVTLTDQADADALTDSLGAIADLDLSRRLGGHDPRDLDDADLVVLNPAVDKRRSPFFQEIDRRGIDWTTEMNLFCERCPARVIGVTGSYGKSTTCAMLDRALRGSAEAGVDAARIHLGGNIGRSLLGELPRMRRSDLVVLEMSNAQLEDLPRIDWTPEVAVITNVHPHHLDRYDDFGAYIVAKLNIVACDDAKQPVVVGDLHPQAFAALTERVNNHGDRIVPVASPDSPIELRVPGAHNRANAACAWTTARTLGVDEPVLRDALSTFAGLPHRLEHVGCFDGVDYYNDSKSTAPAATVVALESIDRPVVAIVGGQMKESVALSDFAAAIARRCRAVVCFGASRSAFAEAIRSTTAVDSEPRAYARATQPGASDAPIEANDGVRTRKPTVHEALDLPEAVRLARRSARTDDVVLFSPGAPSFDAFANFAERGERFTELIRNHDSTV